jgi:hypothetical protein
MLYGESGGLCSRCNVGVPVERPSTPASRLDAGCIATLTQAIVYLNRKTVSMDAEVLRQRVRSPDAHVLVDAIDVALLAGDVEATKMACRAYWELVLRPEAGSEGVPCLP